MLSDQSTTDEPSAVFYNTVSCKRFSHLSPLNAAGSVGFTSLGSRESRHLYSKASPPAAGPVRVQIFGFVMLHHAISFRGSSAQFLTMLDNTQSKSAFGVRHEKNTKSSFEDAVQKFLDALKNVKPKGVENVFVICTCMLKPLL